MNDGLFILIGNIGEDFQCVALRCDERNRYVSHYSLPNFSNNPSRWRMRSDDNIVVWSNDFSEEQRQCVNEYIEKKFNVVPSGHKQWKDVKELREIHSLCKKEDVAEQWGVVHG